MAEDAMRAVSMNLREGSYAMGATRFQTAIRVVMPAASSGIAAASSRYFTCRGGNHGGGSSCRHATGSHLESDGTSRHDYAYIVQVSLGDLRMGDGHQTIFAAGLTLLLLTLTFNIIGMCCARRYREVY